ncbi:MULTISPECIES: murein biosynthesis integral membrane protein MurJ [unclassified Synechococcus]|uniref:murein biosynthesis integral membrane protein MurJ n=1 Tax=unclassified Synechococcus TaxID=2626047 RepID=UPI0008FF1A71|nr:MULTISPECIES: murein biosynthesis integral membrane protein MurJ [unclassified Synechococcus]APD48184.1 murein biosynthesis integral membrane protein MurJ [Synechococcus sp. SynAce01]MCT0246648.1 murein biosynthesis integral membrane protein MurJ [Synechococcus sp. CS-601]TWB93864.1 putative peptidoglycan lipid II flippase [Synechococcus sp. Ace-Pa]
MAKTLRRIALIVAMATALSKVAGLVRQQVIAAAFGVGAAYDAYNYAYVLPGFLLILLGGINGPFHSAMVSVLARRPRQEGAHVLAAINTLVGVGLLGVTILLVAAADPLITLVGPGLGADRHAIAVLQLRWMAPMALFAGLIGLGFGALNAADVFWLPSVSPLVSSLAMIAGIGLLWWQQGAAISLPATALLGGVVLAGTTTLGALLQWLIQLPALAKQGLHRFRLVWDWHHPGVREVLQVMGPATLSSGMLQINVFTDLFFASGIVGAAAGLGYANLLVQTPLGLLSNVLLVPLLPVFARLTAPADRPALVGRIRQGLMLSNASMLPLGALMVGLAGPIVALVYERGAFDSQAAALVGGLLMAYGLGMPAYLGRDVLVRVFYALGDGVTPFRFSMAGIGFNVIFDWVLVGGPTPWGLQLSALNFGAPGLVLATVAVNLITCVALLLALRKRLGELPLRRWASDTALLMGAALVAGLAAWILSNGVRWPAGLPGLLLQGGLSAGLGLGLYGLLATAAGVPEAQQLSQQIRQRLSRRS